MNKYGLHGKLVAQKGKGNELAAILLEAAELMSTAKGCHQFLISSSKTNPDEITVTEVWDSKDDHDNSLSIEGVGALIGKAMPLLASPPEKGQEFDVLGGIGLK